MAIDAPDISTDLRAWKDEAPWTRLNAVCDCAVGIISLQSRGVLAQIDPNLFPDVYSDLLAASSHAPPPFVSKIIFDMR